MSPEIKIKTQEDSTRVILSALDIARARGAFSFEEASIINEALKVLNQQKNIMENQSEPNTVAQGEQVHPDGVQGVTETVVEPQKKDEQPTDVASPEEPQEAPTQVEATTETAA